MQQPGLFHRNNASFSEKIRMMDECISPIGSIFIPQKMDCIFIRYSLVMIEFETGSQILLRGGCVVTRTMSQSASFSPTIAPIPLSFCSFWISNIRNYFSRQLDLVDKWFHIDEFSKTAHLSTETELCTEMYAVAQRLINHFVKMQGLAISQVM